MSFLTIFIAPKPFEHPHISMIQKNAIQSWKALGPDVDVLLLGDEPGIEEAAGEMNVGFIPSVERNAHGTPLISSIFNLAREHSSSPVLAYVNADILLRSDFLETIKNVHSQRSHYLLLGQRWDLDVNAAFDFEKDWMADLEDQLKQNGKLHPRGGSDYFVYPRTCFENIPDFAIGRAGWDNWMIYEARQQGWPVIDSTPSIDIVHQNHDYHHLPGGQSHYRLPETFENIRLAGGLRTVFSLFDADHEIKDGRISKLPMDWQKFWREVEIFPLVILKSKLLANLFFGVFHPCKGYQEFRQWLKKENTHA